MNAIDSDTHSQLMGRLVQCIEQNNFVINFKALDGLGEDEEESGLARSMWLLYKIDSMLIERFVDRRPLFIIDRMNDQFLVQS